MKPSDLLKTAGLLLDSNGGMPSDASIRRAASSAYYALFHCLAALCAERFIGTDITTKAYRQVYRSLDHTNVKTCCKRQTIKKFPKAIEDFASIFVQMQQKRHNADYDPAVTFSASEIRNDIVVVERAIADLRAGAEADLRAFCAYIILRRRAENMN